MIELVILNTKWGAKAAKVVCGKDSKLYGI